MFIHFFLFETSQRRLTSAQATSIKTRPITLVGNIYHCQRAGSQKNLLRQLQAQKQPKHEMSAALAIVMFLPVGDFGANRLKHAT